MIVKWVRRANGVLTIKCSHLFILRDGSFFCIKLCKPVKLEWCESCQQKLMSDGIRERNIA